MLGRITRSGIFSRHSRLYAAAERATQGSHTRPPLRLRSKGSRTSQAPKPHQRQRTPQPRSRRGFHGERICFHLGGDFCDGAGLQMKHCNDCIVKFPNCPCNTCERDQHMPYVDEEWPCCQYKNRRRSCTDQTPCPKYKKERSPKRPETKENEKVYKTSKS